MTAIWFYHLQRQPLEAVLPSLVMKSLERGWRVVIEAGDEERIAALDDHLWTFAEDSFLPHGTDKEPDPASQPVLLTTKPDNPNGAAIRLLVAGAGLPDAIEGYERLVLIFDGADEDALARARADWSRLKGQGADLSYWQQDENGRWGKRG
jgi:DNA polymerase-3 subunit chi